MVFNNSLTINWIAGVKIDNNNKITVTFPKAFNNVYTVYATIVNYSSYYNHTCATNITNTTCVLRNYRSAENNNLSIYSTCFAIGN